MSLWQEEPIESATVDIYSEGEQLLCGLCGAHLCFIEDQDTLGTLVRKAIYHGPKCTAMKAGR